MQEDTKNYFQVLRREQNGKSFSVTKAKKLNEYEFVNGIRENVQKNLHGIKATPLVELASSAREYGGYST